MRAGIFPPCAVSNMYVHAYLITGHRLSIRYSGLPEENRYRSYVNDARELQRGRVSRRNDELTIARVMVMPYYRREVRSTVIRRRDRKEDVEPVVT